MKASKLTEWLNTTIGRVRESWPSRNENGSHQWMLMIISMQAPRTVSEPILKTLSDVELFHGDDSPASAWYYP